MLSSYLHAFLTKFLRLDESTIHLIEEHVKVGDFRNKDVIKPTDNHSNYLYFVETGLCRVFYSTSTKDVTFFFLAEKDFFLFTDSVYYNLPNKLELQAIGNTQIISIDFIFLNSLLKDEPKYHEIKEHLFVDYISKSNERMFFLRFTSPKERYKHLMMTQPNLFNIAPLGYIASYLGITPETLSRLRSAL